MKEVKRTIGIAALLLAAIFAVSCAKAEEAGVPGEEITTPGVSEIDENNLMFVGIVETAGTAEDFN